MSSGAGAHEALESYYERLENSNRFHCFERKDSAACHDLANFLETRKKKFVEALKVYKTNCFKNNFGQSCWSYGQLMHRGKKGVETDLTEATKGYLHGCNVKNYSGPTCDTIGMLLLHDNPPEIESVLGPKNVDKAGKMFIRGCEADDNVSCAHAAVFYNDDKYSSKDVRLAFKYAAKGCELNSGHCCTIAAKACKEGIGTDKNEELFNYYNERAKALNVQIRQVKR